MCCAYVRKVHCAVVGTASGSVQGQSCTRYTVAIHQARKITTDWPGQHNNLNRYVPGQHCTEHQPMSQSRRFAKGVGHCRRIFHMEGGVAHQPLLVSENYSDCPLVRYQNIRSASSSFVTIHASDGETDRRMDRIAIAILCVASQAVVR